MHVADEEDQVLDALRLAFMNTCAKRMHNASSSFAHSWACESAGSTA
jgi:hypothetical protein